MKKKSQEVYLATTQTGETALFTNGYKAVGFTTRMGQTALNAHNKGDRKAMAKYAKAMGMKYIGSKIGEEHSFKLGQHVTPTKGPHANKKHRVIHVLDDGEHLNIKPVGIHPTKVQYRLGAAKAHHSDLRPIKEEALDELSKKTLGSYVKKATRDIKDFTRDNDTRLSRRIVRNRIRGTDKAVDRLTKEGKEWQPLGGYIGWGSDAERDPAFKKEVKARRDSERKAAKSKPKKRVRRVRESVDTEKREDIVKGMKKNFSDFKKRYGPEAKSVMYATATKMAKESVDEGRRRSTRHTQLSLNLSGNPKVGEYVARKQAQRKADAKKQDPSGSRKGLAKNVVDTTKARYKAKKRGISHDAVQKAMTWKTVNSYQAPNRLPEDFDIFEAVGVSNKHRKDLMNLKKKGVPEKEILQVIKALYPTKWQEMHKSYKLMK